MPKGLYLAHLRAGPWAADQNWYSEATWTPPTALFGRTNPRAEIRVRTLTHAIGTVKVGLLETYLNHRFAAIWDPGSLTGREIGDVCYSGRTHRNSATIAFLRDYTIVYIYGFSIDGMKSETVENIAQGIDQRIQVFRADAQRPEKDRRLIHPRLVSAGAGSSGEVLLAASLARSLGIGVTVEKRTGEVMLERPQRRTAARIGEPQAEVNGETITLRMAPRWIGPEAYLPVELLQTVCRVKVQWTPPSVLTITRVS